MSKKAHIAIMGIKGLPSKGGGERVAELIIEKYVKSGFKVTVYGKNDYNELAKIKYDVNVINIPYIKGKHIGPFSFGLLSAFHALIFGNYDLIHLHYADFGFIVPLLRIRYKIIGTSHGAEYNRDKWNSFAKLFFKLVEPLFVKYVNICTCVSAELKKYYELKYKRQVYFIPNGIKISGNDYKENSYILDEYNLPNLFCLFAAGRIIPSKGCDLLLKAFYPLHNGIPLVIIGDLEWNQNYKLYIKGLANKNVIFINFIADKDLLFKIISKCSFFVFPSTYEAMSMMLLEVASLKKGIVCSDIIQNKDAIGDNAVYFKSGDIVDLRNKLTFAMENIELMDSIGLKAFTWIKENRNWDKISNNYLALISYLL